MGQAFWPKSPPEKGTLIQVWPGSSSSTTFTRPVKVIREAGRAGKKWPPAKACVHFLETSLEAKKACVLLSQSRLFEEPELTQRCWEVIDEQAEMALQSEGFCEIDWQTLEIVVTREALNTKEAVIFKAVLNWAEAECKRQGLLTTPRNKRHVLGLALYLVRIPAMTLEEFANGAAQSDILMLEETHNIFLWYTVASKPPLDFPLNKRRGLAPQRCHCFQALAYRSNQWRYQGRCDSIQFAVDRRVFVAGLGLYGSSSGKAEYSVKIELKRLGVVLAQNLTRFVSDGSSSTFPVWFEHPVQVEQDTFYTASAMLDGSELCYFGQEGLTEVQCGKVTSSSSVPPIAPTAPGCRAGRSPSSSSTPEAVGMWVLGGQRAAPFLLGRTGFRTPNLL
ncbi:BTB/POZ domain-containing protein 6 [Myotis brandtii]|uniref:BTB/POZ domain-containing protein 6 n=1 Tax=Myotis brandtii TaxID=109478 RepID=S7NUB4_MYOBR|nr:BTB/POZ domain-containing protein 6 [Myotis brandtii]